MQVLEDELAEAKMTASKSNANSIALKSNYEIQVAELNSRINEMEEEALIESGRARIAGNTTHHHNSPFGKERLRLSVLSTDPYVRNLT